MGEDEQTKGEQMYDCYEFALGEQGIGIDPWDALEKREQDAWEIFAEKAEEMIGGTA